MLPMMRGMLFLPQDQEKLHQLEAQIRNLMSHEPAKMVREILQATIPQMESQVLKEVSPELK